MESNSEQTQQNDDLSGLENSQLRNELEMLRIELEFQKGAFQKAIDNAGLSTNQYSKLYDEIYNSSPVGYFILTPQSTILNVNIDGALMLEKNHSTLINSNFSLFIAPESLHVFENFLDQIFRTKSRQSCQVWLAKETNQKCIVHLEGILSETEQKCLVTAIDTTLPEIDNNVHNGLLVQWQSVFDSINDGVCLLSNKQQIIRYNTAMLELFPDLKGELTGKTCWEVVHGTQEPLVGCPFIEMKKSLKRESNIQRYNGRWFQVTVDPIFDMNNKLSGAIHIIRDITESKQIEEELNNKLTLLQIAGRTAKFGGWSIELKNNKVIWSDQVASLHGMPMGYSPTLSEGISFYAPECIEKITEVFNDCVLNGIPYDEILQIINNKGERVWVRTTGQAVEDEKGQIVKVQGSFQDVTEQKKTEELLRISKEFAERLIQTTNAIVVGMDSSGNIQIFNKAAEKITGYTIDDLSGKNWFEVIVPKDHFPEVWEIFENLEDGGLPTYFENPILTKSGEERFIIWYNNEVREYDKIVGAISFGIDITDRKISEEAIRISEAKYRKLYENVKDGFILTSMDGKVNDCNSAFLKMLGYTFEEISNLTYIDFTPKKWHEFESEIVNNQVIPNGYSQVYEKEYINKDGTIFPVELTVFLINNEDGSSQGMWGIVRDISHRKFDEAINKSRIHLIQFSLSHTLNELLEEMLNEIELNTDSKISFSHFLSEDQKNLSLQNWSTRTKNDFCNTDGQGLHYPISEAGVWVDCVHERKPVIHNDYASLPHRKGMPEGHAKVVRELVVPVFKGEKIAAIIGVGNKETNYTTHDAEYLQTIANLAWEIIERIKVEEALKVSEDHFRKIFNTSPIGMALVNSKFYFLEANPSFCEFIKFSNQELSNKSFSEITHPDYISQDIESVTKLMQGRLDIYSVEKKYIRKDKKVVWGNAFVTPVFDINKNFQFFLVMIKDINESKKAEDEILRINNNLKELNAAKDKFFSIIAHDLKNPFNSIVGFSEILLDQIKEKNYNGIEKYSEIILNSSNHAMDLLTNLMEWARSQTGTIKFNPELFDIVELIDEAEVLLSDIAKQKSIKIEKSMPSNGFVFADRDMVNTVLRNLISNAIKFTRSGGNIIISATINQDELSVSIVDNGIGMSVEKISKLFRLDEGISTKGTSNEKGTGLGLILCKEFIDKHNGKIWVESVEGKGSTFTFSISMHLK